MLIREIRGKKTESNMNKKHPTGFTIVELLVALTIMAMLMAAVGLAFDASVKNHHANQGIYKTTNTARQALVRITNDIRTAYDAGSIPDNDPDESQLTLYKNDAFEVKAIYHYDSAEQKLYLQTDSGGPYLLCENVTEMTFHRADDGNKIRNIRIKMTLTGDQGDLPQTLAAAAVIRRNL